MEVPDILDWVKPGHLLITTGFAIRDDIQAQKTLISSLAQKNVAGLCIKTRRYLDEIPAPVLAQADLYDFPVIELSQEINFADLIHDVLNTILQKQTNYLIKMLDIHNSLMGFMVDGEGLQKIVDTISMFVNNPVYILDTINNRQVSCSNVGSDCKIDHLLELTNDKKFAQDKTSITTPYHGYANVTINENETRCFFMSLMVAGKGNGYILIEEKNQTLTSNDIYVIEKLSIVLALEIARECSIREVQYRYCNEFLLHLLTGRVDNDNIEIEQAKKFGWDIRKNFVVAVTYLTANDNKLKLPDQEKINRIVRKIPGAMLEKNLYCLTCIKGDYIILLLDVGDVNGLTLREINELAKLKFETVLDFLEVNLPDCDIYTGLGRFHQGIKGLQTSYQEAKHALKLGESIGKKAGISSFSDLGLYRLIFSGNRDKEIQIYLQETINKLIEYDKERKTELVRTLQVYFMCNGNLKKVSETLFAHYNTILYRIERIQEICGFDLNCPEDRFNLEVALKLLETCS
jgi:purine catabolism regulator